MGELMRWSVVLAILLGGVAHAKPLGVTIACEETGRTKACPAFLLGLVDANYFHPVVMQL